MSSSILERGSGSQVFYDAITNTVGIIGGQLILFIATPFLARVYEPEQFGVYTLLVAVASIIATGATFRIDIALPAANCDEVAPLLRLGLLACGSTLVIGMGATALNVHLFLPWPSAIAGPFLSRLCVIAGVLQGLALLVSALAVQSGNFRHTALLRLLQPSVFVFAALCSIPGGLNLAFFIGLATVCSVGLIIGARELCSPVSFTNLMRSARKYWEYPVISLPMAILDTLTLAMPVFFIVDQYGESAAGNFSQVQRLVAAPILLAAAALSQVFYKHAADAHHATLPIRPFMWKIVARLALGSVLLTVLILFFGRPVLSIFLGAVWRTDTRFLILLLIPMVARLIVSPISSVFLIVQRIRLGALWQILYFLVSYNVLRIASNQLSFDNFLGVLLISEVCMYTLYLWMADIAVRQPSKTV